MIPWGRVREERRLDIAVSQIFIFSNAVSEEKLPSWLPCVHHLKYCKLLCMDLNCNHICFSCMRHWWIKKKDLRKLYIILCCQVVFLYLGNCREREAEKNNPFHSLCTVYGLCRLMQIFWNEMFRRDHTTKAGVKKLAFLVCSRCIVNFTVILIANISKYRLYIYLYIVFHKA